jgi:hypothetical protein
MRDLHGETTVVAALVPAVVTATGNGPAIDLRGYQGIGKIILNCAAAGAGTNPTMDVKVQDSAANSTDWLDVSPALAFSQVTNADSIQSIGVDTRAVRRYIRLVKTIGGTSNPSFAMSASLVIESQYKS